MPGEYRSGLFRRSRTGSSRRRKRKPGEQVGTLQVVWEQDRIDEMKKVRHDRPTQANRQEQTWGNLLTR